MKKIATLIMFACFNYASIAQTTEVPTNEIKEPIVKFSGHIRFEGWVDSHESELTRDGDIIYYPTRAVLTNSGDDIKAYYRTGMTAAQSRFRAKINGPDALNAKVTGMVEVDFLGIDDANTRMPRIRHMFMNLKWEKSQLLLGQTWHPVFVAECFPEVHGMGAALPFNPLNRAPQIRVSYNPTAEFEIAVAALSHIDFKSKGPADAQYRAVVPDLHGHIKYKTSHLAIGLVGGINTLKPRTINADSTPSKQKVQGWDVVGFAKYTVNNLTFKLYGIYGANLSPYAMIGGYSNAEPTSVNDYSYSSILTTSVWGEAMYKVGSFEYGLFAGYSSNLGTTETNFEFANVQARGGDIKNIIRLSPRASYTVGRIMFGAEYMLTGATYMNVKPNVYEATKTDDMVYNNRYYLSATYTF